MSLKHEPASEPLHISVEVVVLKLRPPPPTQVVDAPPSSGEAATLSAMLDFFYSARDTLRKVCI